MKKVWIVELTYYPTTLRCTVVTDENEVYDLENIRRIKFDTHVTVDYDSNITPDYTMLKFFHPVMMDKEDDTLSIYA